MPQESLTDHQVLTEIRALARQSKVGWTRHAQERMAERGFDKGQIKRCLASGNFIEQPYIPNRNGELEYKFTLSAHVDGEIINVAASLIPEKKIVVITVIDPNN